MKSQDLTKEHLDIIFKEIYKENLYTCSFTQHQVITTFDIRNKLWEKYRIYVKKDAEVVRKKIREWWNSYKWKYEPRPHKMICEIAVYLASAMSYDYCMLGDKKSLICVYDDQSEFSTVS